MSERRTRIGIFHIGALGDCVLALHVARAAAASSQLAGDGGSAELVAVARSSVARLAVGRGVVGGYWDLDTAGISALFVRAGDLNALSPVATAAIRNLDAIISFCGGPDVPPATRLREIAAAPVWAIDPRVRPETIAAGCHITEQWIADLRLAGLNVPPPESTALIRLDDTDREHGQRCWTDIGVSYSECATHFDATKKPDGPSVALGETAMFFGGRASCPPLGKPDVHPPLPLAADGSPTESDSSRRRVLLHPGSGGRTKCWPLDRFEALANRLSADGCVVAWMIGPVEMDWHGEAIRERLARTAPVIHEEDLARAASVIATADVFVGNDSGITHLAAALGVPTVAVFVSTDPRVWRPLGPAVRSLGGGAAAGSCSDATVADVSSAVAEVCAAR